MKHYVPVIILILAVTALCVWDGLYTTKTFNSLTSQSEEIYAMVSEEDINFNNLSTKVEELNTFWTKQTDILCVSISRKDLQPVSDYIQYLAGSVKNRSAEDCFMYAKLLNYNVIGLSEAYGISFANLL